MIDIKFGDIGDWAKKSYENQWKTIITILLSDPEHVIDAIENAKKRRKSKSGFVLYSKNTKNALFRTLLKVIDKLKIDIDEPKKNMYKDAFRGLLV